MVILNYCTVKILLYICPSSQGPSLDIIGVQAKTYTCIINPLTIVNVGLSLL